MTYEYKATVVKWVDGDTVDLRVDLGFRMFAETRFRLYGIDTPEDSAGKPAAARSRELAPEGSKVGVATYKDPDKYGRWLASVLTAEGIDVTAQLLREGLGYAYFGGKKQ